MTEIGPLDMAAAIGALARQVVAEVDGLEHIEDDEPREVSIAASKIHHLCDSLAKLATAHADSAMQDHLAAQERKGARS
jgi:hypothetical protein